MKWSKDFCPTCGQPWPPEAEDERWREDPAIGYRPSPRERQRLGLDDRESPDERFAEDDRLIDPRRREDDDPVRGRLQPPGGCLLLVAATAGLILPVAARAHALRRRQDGT